MFKHALYLEQKHEKVDVTKLAFGPARHYYSFRDIFIIVKDKFKIFEEKLTRASEEQAQQVFVDIELARIRITSRTLELFVEETFGKNNVDQLEVRMMKNDNSNPSINLDSLNLSQGSIRMDTPDQTPLIKVKETVITPENQDM